MPAPFRGKQPVQFVTLERNLEKVFFGGGGGGRSRDIIQKYQDH